VVGIFIHEHSCGVYIYISGNLNILSLIECNFVLFPLLVLVMILRAIFGNLNNGQNIGCRYISPEYITVY
jgi:hypothetical protein